MWSLKHLFSKNWTRFQTLGSLTPKKFKVMDNTERDFPDLLLLLLPSEYTVI